MDTWIESHVTLRNHKKVFMLCNELKIERAQALGHLHMLWWWAIENRENGDLTGIFTRDIAHACDWSGDAEILLKALKKCGWIGKNMEINDWHDYSWRLLAIRKSNRERQRKYRDVTRDVTRDITCDVTHATRPDQTVPDQTVKGLLLKTQEKQLKKLISKRLNHGLDSEANEIEYKKLLADIEKDNEIKDPVAVAFYRAKHGFKT